MVNPASKWVPVLLACSGQNGDWAIQQVRSDSLSFFDARRSKVFAALRCWASCVHKYSCEWVPQNSISH
jgi:hypothetical protein